MKQKKDKNLWKFREAKKVSSLDRFLMLTLIAGGVFSTLRLFDWWFREIHIAFLPAYLVLSCIFWWGVLRMLLMWVNLLRIQKPEVPSPETGLSVALFITSSPGEPLAMFDKTLEACARIQYPHVTYLLDDTQDPAFRTVAEKHGAVWLELVGLPGAKAGKINAALKLTREEFILVLDPDHIPFPNFLEQTLGFFQDPKVGFVQVCQNYYNQYRSFTAAAAAEQTYGFYGPTQMALNGYGCAVAIGANCTFRRKALESIGGHGVGLAEDLITSIRLHAAGWKSVYNPVVVSRGLVPEDFGSFCKQQLKWSRGVHEVVFTEWPKLQKKLSFWQKLSYMTIGTYYLVGWSMLLYNLIPLLYFWLGLLPAHMDFPDFLVHWLPMVGFAAAIYLFSQKWLAHPDHEKGLHWRGMILKFACWPVFFLGFALSLIDRSIPYIPTAKKAVRGLSPFARPLWAHVGLFLLTLLWVILNRRYWVPEEEMLLHSAEVWGMIGFAFIGFLLSLAGLWAAFESSKLPEDEPWAHIDPLQIETDSFEN